ncbi:late secretory pathway protein avl9 [Chytriomyces hyalinus]|nr:late secretory pathway protein avl9 [Chytriomyces hyalinus]
MEADSTDTVLRVLVASFHHRNGNQIDYAVPAFETSTDQLALPDYLASLPFLCIPDGAHALSAIDISADSDSRATQSNFVYFQIPIKGKKPIFGVSCFSQINASELTTKGDDVTRSMVQKAVVVLTSEPIFGPLVQKLGLVTNSFFAQRDFSNLAVIDEFYQSLKNTFHSYVSDLDLHMGLNVRETVTLFKGSLLQIVKLILLERRILFFGTNTSRLGETQYGILSLMPGLLRSFCVGKPEQAALTAESALDLRTDGRLDSLGLPLHVFGEETPFLPFISLHQIDLLTSPEVKGFMFGTSNSIFAVQRGSNIDAIVNTDTGAVEILNPELQPILRMTASDRAFIEELVDTVVDSWEYDNENLDNDPLGDYEGSDNYIRAQFEAYLVSLLATVKYSLLTMDQESASLIADFNDGWVDAWMDTENYKKWNLSPHVELGPDLMRNPGHIKWGAMEDPFAATLQGIRKSIVAPIQTNLGKAFVQAEAGFSTAVTNLTDPEQQKVMQEKLASTMANASKAAETALSSAKETAQDFGKAAEVALTSAGKAAETAFSHAGKAAHDGLTNVVAGFKDPVVMQENANKVISNVTENAKNLWTTVGTWGGSLFNSSVSLSSQHQQHQQATEEEILLHDESDAADPFIVGDASSLQNLKFHDIDEETDDKAAKKNGGAAKPTAKTDTEGAEEVGYSFI